MGHLHCGALCFFFVLFIMQILQFGCPEKAYNSTISCIPRERNALLKFKEYLIDRANRLSSWTGEECCKWKGVRCNKHTGHVVTLDLRNRVFYDSSRYYTDPNYSAYYRNSCLKGEISFELLNVETLQHLDLSMNNFSGIQIPSFFGSFKYLRYLNLSMAGFHGMIPQHLGNLSSLQYLDLSGANMVEAVIGNRYNNVSATSLLWTSQLSSLKSLDLSGANLEEAGDWLHIINMLPSLISLSLANCGLNSTASLFHVNRTSLASLDLSNNDFGSTIPFWLFNLSSLVDLKLSSNEFRGPIPNMFGQLTYLSVLDLSANFFNTSLPNKICTLRNLVHMDLSENFLQGSLAVCLGNLTSLTVLKLNANNFEGTIPSEIGHLRQLIELTLSSNELKGTIPSNLWQLKNLRVLDISNNSLVGLLSDLQFVNLKGLKVLSISSTFLTFNLSSQWIPPFQLQEISMNSIPLGPKFPAWLKMQTNVKILSMSNASISDDLPHWFEIVHSRIHFLDLSNNKIKGIVPNFQTETNGRFRHIDLNSNKFQGSLKSFPPDTGDLDLSNNFLIGDIPQPQARMSSLSLVLLFLNDNRLTGNIPDYLCDIQSLTAIDLSNNQLSRRIPLCLGNLPQLVALNLANNSLSGLIPSSLGNLESLRFLHLSKNKFQGKLPKNLQNLKILKILDLGENHLKGIIPEWIGKGLLHLIILRLQSNNFYGDIPQHLCHLSSLQLLNVAQNQITGRIPLCFGNFTAMASRDPALGFMLFDQVYHLVELSYIMKGRELVYTSNLKYLKAIVLSGNNIVGEIPEELMVLKGLQSLNLSNNHLSGQIPERIGNLKQLESLDLSSNKLSGSIPPSLATIFTLVHLNLSFNKLSGRIPWGRQLQTLDDPSIYEGNNGLCDKPLQNNCSDDIYPEGNGPTPDYEKGKEPNWPWFCAGIGPGFGVGLLGVLCILHFKKSWRYAYFQFVGNVFNK